MLRSVQIKPFRLASELTSARDSVAGPSICGLPAALSNRCRVYLLKRGDPGPKSIRYASGRRFFEALSASAEPATNPFDTCCAFCAAACARGYSIG